MLLSAYHLPLHVHVLLCPFLILSTFLCSRVASSVSRMRRREPEQTWPGPAPHSLTGARHCDLTPVCLSSLIPRPFPSCSLPSSHLELHFLPHAKHLPDSGPAFLEALLPLPASSSLLSRPYPAISWLMDAKQKQLIRHQHGAVLGPQVWGSQGKVQIWESSHLQRLVYPFLPIVKTSLLHLQDWS